MNNQIKASFSNALIVKEKVDESPDNDKENSNFVLTSLLQTLVEHFGFKVELKDFKSIERNNNDPPN